MATIELTTAGRMPCRVGGDGISAICAALISVPGARDPSLQILATQDVEPTHPVWNLRPPPPQQWLTLRCLGSGDLTVPGDAWKKTAPELVVPTTGERRDSFVCNVELGGEKPLRFAVSGSTTFQLTLQYHFTRAGAKLEIGCTGGEGIDDTDSWLALPVSFDQLLRLRVA